MALFGKKKPSGAKAYNQLSQRDRAVTFFAEDGGSWPHFEPILHELTTTHGLTVSYLTSSATDPVLTTTNERLRAFDVGDGLGRTMLFQLLEAGVFVATLPRLGISVFPRSKKAKALGTQYINVFHSMASTHMIYDADGFDEYDTIMCVGPFMVDEIRAREQAFGLPTKQLVDHGYGRLDSIIANRSQAATLTSADRAAGDVNVLIAPSWGPTCIFETCGVELVRELLADGCTVVARPHPETVKRTPEAIERLRASHSAHPSFTLEVDVASQESLHRCDIMISDWSGAALEYAFGLERPVLFIDVARKVNNPEWHRLGIEPFEASVREQIGAIVRPADLATVPAKIRSLVANPAAFSERIRSIRDASIFNVGSSGAVAAQHIATTVAPYLAKVSA
jgi:YidC/Oxa1 family membrane protein insertase